MEGGLRCQDRLEFRDLLCQLIAALLQFNLRIFGEAAQAQLKDVVGLSLRQVEDLLKPGPRSRGVIRGTDNGNDVIDVEDRHKKTLNKVEVLLSLI